MERNSSVLWECTCGQCQLIKWENGDKNYIWVGEYSVKYCPTCGAAANSPEAYYWSKYIEVMFDMLLDYKTDYRPRTEIDRLKKELSDEIGEEVYKKLNREEDIE